MIPAFAYLRVSGKSQIEGDGFPRQHLAINKHAAVSGYEIAATFEEKGVTGEMDGADRPAWSAMIERCRATNVAVVIFERLDRLARDLMVQETMLAQAKKIGILPVSTSEPDLASTDPTRILMRQIMGGVAQWDKAQIVNKLRGARQRKKEQTGRCEGRKPYGEKEGEAHTLQVICKMRLSGKTWQAIADDLNNRLISTRVPGKMWFPSTVSNIAGGDRMQTILAALYPEQTDLQLCMAVPCVYAWRRGTEWLYIGSTSQLLTRMRTHDVIGKHEPIQTGDLISLWPGPQEAIGAHEMSLIRERTPKYNVVGLLGGDQIEHRAANWEREKAKDVIGLASSMGISEKSLKRLAGDTTDGRKRRRTPQATTASIAAPPPSPTAS